MVMSDFLNELNEAQRAAVVSTEGPSLVIAGAGSGKTRVLTYRIAWLLSQGVSPSNILALTFTNKAAREMKERIAHLVGDKYARYLWMGTFHSIFSKILRQESARIGYGHDYTIYDSTDSKSVIKQIVKEMGLDDKLPALYIPAIAAPVVFFYLYQAMESTLPYSIVEAARVDGCNEFRTFNTIALPMMKPSIAVQAIFAFVSSWNKGTVYYIEYMKLGN